MGQGFPFRTQAQAPFQPQPAAANAGVPFPAVNQPYPPQNQPQQQPQKQMPQQAQQQIPQAMQGQPVNGMTPPQGMNNGVNTGMPMPAQPQPMPGAMPANGLPGASSDQQAAVQQMLNDPNMMDVFQKQVESVAGNDLNQQMNYMMEMMQDPSKADAFIRDMQAQGVAIPGMPQGAQGMPAGINPAQAGVDPNAPAVPEMPEGFLEPDDMIKGAAVGVPLALGLKELADRGVVYKATNALDNLPLVEQANKWIQTKGQAHAETGLRKLFKNNPDEAVKQFQIFMNQVEPSVVKEFNGKGVLQALEKRLVSDARTSRWDRLTAKISRAGDISGDDFKAIKKVLNITDDATALEKLNKLDKSKVDDAIKAVLGENHKGAKKAAKAFSAAQKYSGKQLGMVDQLTANQKLLGPKTTVGRGIHGVFNNIKSIFNGDNIKHGEHIDDVTSKIDKALRGTHKQFTNQVASAGEFSAQKLNAEAAVKSLEKLDGQIKGVTKGLASIQVSASDNAVQAINTLRNASDGITKQAVADLTKTLSKPDKAKVKAAAKLLSEQTALKNIAKDAPSAIAAHSKVVGESGRYSLKTVKSFINKEVSVHGSKASALKKNMGKLFGPFLAGALVVGFAFNASKKADTKEEKRKMFAHNFLGEGMGLFFGWLVAEKALRTTNIATKMLSSASMGRFARMGSVGGFVAGIAAMTVLSVPFKKVGEAISHTLFGKPNKELLEEKEKAGIKVYSPDNFPPGSTVNNNQQNPQAQGLDRSGSKYSDMFNRTTPAVDESGNKAKLDDPNAPSDMPFSDGLVYTPEEIVQNRSREVQNADNKKALADLNQAWEMSGLADLTAS